MQLIIQIAPLLIHRFGLRLWLRRPRLLVPKLTMADACDRIAIEADRRRLGVPTWMD